MTRCSQLLRMATFLLSGALFGLLMYDAWYMRNRTITIHLNELGGVSSIQNNTHTAITNLSFETVRKP